MPSKYWEKERLKSQVRRLYEAAKDGGSPLSEAAPNDSVVPDWYIPNSGLVLPIRLRALCKPKQLGL